MIAAINHPVRNRGVSGDRAHLQAVEEHHHLIEELYDTNG